MKLDVTFKENKQRFDTSFGEVFNVSDGGYDRGYDAGYNQGYTEGYTKGETVGRQTKTGTFTIDKNNGTPTITHNCGFIPTVLIVYPLDEYVDGDQMILGSIVTNTSYFSSIPLITNVSNSILEVKTNGIAWNFSTTKDAILTETTATLGYAVGTRLWRANFQYGWIAIE